MILCLVKTILCYLDGLNSIRRIKIKLFWSGYNMITKQRLKEEKLKEEQWQEYEAKTINYFGKILKEGTDNYNKYQNGDL
jgi:hypothetical protein